VNTELLVVLAVTALVAAFVARWNVLLGAAAGFLAGVVLHLLLR
jgi:hypothetical protein